MVPDAAGEEGAAGDDGAAEVGAAGDEVPALGLDGIVGTETPTELGDGELGALETAIVDVLIQVATDEMIGVEYAGVE